MSGGRHNPASIGLRPPRATPHTSVSFRRLPSHAEIHLFGVGGADGLRHSGRDFGEGQEALPPPLNVGADYGLTALNVAQAEKALKLVLFILSPDAQQILARYGFSAPTRLSP